MTSDQFATSSIANEDLILDLITDKDTILIGDIINFTIKIKNISLDTTTNLTISIPPKNGITIDNESLSINGIKYIGNVENGINIGEVTSKEEKIITFKGKSTQVLKINPTVLAAKAIYNINGSAGILYSNDIDIYFGSIRPEILITKIVNNSMQSINKELVYISTIQNLSENKITNGVFYDLLQKGMVQIPNSIIIDELNVAGGDIESGIVIGELLPGESKIIQYRVKLTIEAENSLLETNSRLKYSYETGYGLTSSIVESNLVMTRVTALGAQEPKLILQKIANKGGIIVGEEITYTISLENKGDLLAENVVISDIVPEGLQFVTGSVILDGIGNSSLNIVTGVNVGNIGVNAGANIQFKAIATALPNINPANNKAIANYKYTPTIGNPPITASVESNVVQTVIAQKDILTILTKSVDKSYGKSGDIVNFTLTSTNTSVLVANNVEIMDYIDSKLTFVENSVKVNGATILGADIRNGVATGDLSPGNTVTVSFQAKINSTAIPGDIIKNNGELTYSFKPAVNSDIQYRTIESNTTTIQINEAIIEGSGLVKTADKTGAGVTEIITYTITMKNTGNVVAENIILTDTIQEGTVFNQGSVTVNGESRPQSSPITGINIGTIGAGETAVVRFQVVVNSTPINSKVENQGIINYSYREDPNSANRINVKAATNTTSVNIIEIPITPGPDGFYKRVDLENCTVGDIIVYTVTAQNRSSVTASNIVLTDKLNSAVEFIPGSLTIDDVPTTNNPTLGVPLGEIKPLDGKIVKFNVKVKSIPSNYNISNSADLSYQYTVQEGTQPKTINITSNIVSTNVNIASISGDNGTFTKSVNKGYASVGEELTYTIFLKNTGNVSANNVILLDTVPSYTTYVPGSVTVNGVINPSLTPLEEMNVGNLGSMQPLTLTYRVIVNTIPKGGVIKNKCDCRYNFTVDQDAPNGRTAETSTNTVSTVVRQAVLERGLTKQTSTSYVVTGDFIDYTITIINTGNVDAINVILTDTIATQSQFVPDSVTIDGVKIPGGDVSKGVLIGKIAPQQQVVLGFTVKVTNFNDGDIIYNKANVAYSYIINPDTGEQVNKVASTNVTDVKINQARISESNGDLIKSVDLDNAAVGDILTYRVKIRNSGTTAAVNVNFTDKIPAGTTFVPNSLRLDGETVPGANPELGVQIASINVNEVVYVEFKVKIDILPPNSEILNRAEVEYRFLINPVSGREGYGSDRSNIVKTIVNEAVLVSIKETSKKYAKLGDFIDYTITLTNTGNVSANNVKLVDEIPNGTELVQGSVKLNGVIANENILEGQEIGGIGVGKTSIITFTVKVIKLPTINPISNVANINYSYINNPQTGSSKNVNTSTNVITTKINTAIITNGDGGFTKIEDKNSVTIGDTIQYQIKITNTGNAPAIGVILTDVLDNDVNYVSGSLMVNGNTNSGNIQSGITLPNISPQETVKVTFKVLVTTIGNGKVDNKSNIMYSYILNEDTGEKINQSSDTNMVTALIRDPLMSITKAASTYYGTVLQTITYSVVVKSSGNVDSTNVVVQDTIPKEVNFIPGSVKVNGIVLPLANPTTGIKVGVVDKGSVTTVTYDVVATKAVGEGIVNNVANLGYSFEVDESTGILTNRNITSNKVTIVIKDADISLETGGLIKSADKQFADICDVITYTITMINKGNTVANSVVLTDTLQNEVSFNKGSVTINSIPYIDYSPIIGVPVGSIKVNEVVTVTFKVTVESLPKPNVIDNFVNVNYKYTTDPSLPNSNSKTNQSNHTQTIINRADISNATGGFTKSTCKKAAKIGDEIDYVIELINKGNVIAEEVLLKDTIPAGLVYIDNTLTVNGVQKPLDDIQKGILIGAISPGQKVIVEFKTLVKTMPKTFEVTNDAIVSYKYLVDPVKFKYCSTTNISNKVTTTINMAEISNQSGGFIKEANKKYAEYGEVISYVITMKNVGNVPTTETKFIDSIPAGTEFVKDSLAINGIIQEGVTPNAGVELGQIIGGAAVTVSFKVVVTTIINSIVSNTGEVSYCYMVDESGCKEGCPICCDCRKVCENNKSNEVYTSIKNGELQVTKVVNEQYATINDELTYTILIKNTGNVDANNVYVIDTVSNGTVYIDNTLTIDNKLVPGENLQRGVNLGTMKPNETKKIQYKVLVNTIPKGDIVPNDALVTFEYVVDPNSITPKKKTVKSNEVITKINYVLIGNEYGTLTKSVNKKYADIGEVISYRIDIINKGNTTASNLVFTDSIPKGTEFVKESLKLNNVVIVGGVPSTGVDIGSLAANESVQITFDVVVVTIPKNGFVDNIGSLNYRFTKNPNIPLGEVVYKTTNWVNTKINHGEITDGYKETPGSEPKGGLTKVADKHYAKIGDTITYTFNVTNSGNIDVTNVILYDELQPEMKFIEGSITINDVLIKDDNLKDGINIGTIAPNRSIKVTLKALVVSLPTDVKVENTATVEYRYKVAPDKQPIIKTAKSNEDIIYINCAIISNNDGGFIKQVDKEYVKLNDIITYRIVMKNTGNVTATDVIFKDAIAFGSVLVKDSVIINGVPKINANPQLGIKIPDIDPNETVSIVFKVKVVAIPQSGYINNTGEVLYKYKVDPNKPEVETESLTNTVKVKVNSVDFTGVNFNKVVCPEEITINEVTTYTFNITNKGNVNANNVLLTDSLPAQVEFVDGSVTVNGQAVKSVDPRVGIGLASIKPNETVVVAFKVKAKGFLPKVEAIINVGELYYENVVDPETGAVEGKEESNGGKLYVRAAIIEATKIPMNKITALRDEIWYKVIVTNKGNVPGKCVEIYDELPECLKFVENSVSVDGIDTDYSIVNGIMLGTIKPGESVEVLFRTMVIADTCECEIVNFIKGCSSYYVSECRQDVLYNFESNKAVVLVENPEIHVCKTANKEIAKYCDEVTYNVKVSNVGTLSCYCIKLFDLLPPELKLIGGIIWINGKRINGVDMSKGINLGELQPGEYTEVCYTVVVNKGCCRKIIENKAYAEYKYQICQSVSPKCKVSNIASYKLQGVSTSFQQISIDSIIKLPCHKPDIKDIVDVRGKIQLTNQYVIETMKGFSAENKRITGYKLVLNGKVFESLEYIAQEPTCTTHYQEAVDKFSTFIILSEDYCNGDRVEVIAEIEDIAYEQIGEREVFVTATIILDAIVIC